MTFEYIINTRHGGYCLSKKAYEYLGLEWDGGSGLGFAYDDDRWNPKLIECIKKLGKEANGDGAELKIVEVEIDINVFNKYDGIEEVCVDYYIND